MGPSPLFRFYDRPSRPLQLRSRPIQLPLPVEEAPDVISIRLKYDCPAILPCVRLRIMRMFRCDNLDLMNFFLWSAGWEDWILCSEAIRLSKVVENRPDCEDRLHYDDRYCDTCSYEPEDYAPFLPDDCLLSPTPNSSLLEVCSLGLSRFVAMMNLGRPFHALQRAKYWLPTKQMYRKKRLSCSC